MRQYKVGLVGIGAVGTEMIKVLRQRKFPCSEIRVWATRDQDEEIAGDFLAEVEKTFPDCDVEMHSGGQPIYYYVISVE